jgi:hypothetical protein
MASKQQFVQADRSGRQQPGRPAKHQAPIKRPLAPRPTNPTERGTQDAG